jgi:hypothetical protein
VRRRSASFAFSFALFLRGGEILSFHNLFDRTRRKPTCIQLLASAATMLSN